MAVNVFMKTCRGEFTGKYAELDGRTVSLFFEITPDKRGGYRGCGEKLVFPMADVNVIADQPMVEICVRHRISPLRRVRLLMSWIAGHTDANRHKDNTCQ